MSRRQRRSHEDRVRARAGGCRGAGVAIALPLVWLGDFELKTEITLTLAIALGVLGFAAAARAHVMRPLQTLANLIGALRERDYSVRGRPGAPDDALGAVHGRARRARRAAARGALARRGDRGGAGARRRGARRAPCSRSIAAASCGSRTARPSGSSAAIRLGVPGADGGLADLGRALAEPRTVTLAGLGSWEARPSDVRLAGVPHKLVVMTDVRRALRDEERAAWQRLVRVLGHEINNSLGPIASIAETLRTGLTAPPRADFSDDLARGLEVIERRAAALARFMQSYARLVRLPPPRLGKVDVGAWVRRTADLETRLAVAVDAGPDLEIAADRRPARPGC